MKANKRRRVIAPLILNLGPTWRARAHLNSSASHPRMNPNTHQIGGWIIPRIGKHVFEEDKNLSPLPGFNPCTFQPLAIPAIVLQER